MFTYIGANQDAALEAGKIGVKNSLTFEATIEGTVNMFAFEKQSRQRWNKRVRLNENDIQNDYFSDDDNDNRKGWISIGIQPFLIQSSVPDYLTILTVLMPPSATTLTK